MRSTKIALFVGLSLFAVSLVVPTSHSCKSPITKGSPQTLQADGTPLPPLPPPNAKQATLVADGTPLPPLPPPNTDGAALAA